MQTFFIVAILGLGFLITFQIAKASEYVAVLRGEERARKQTNKVKANGQEVENSTTFGDYKKLPEGIVYPYSVTSGFGETQVVSLEINPTIDDATDTKTRNELRLQTSIRRSARRPTVQMTLRG